MNNNPKKRGRKPKTNIIVNDNPVFKNNNFDDVIVCINNTDNIDSISNINDDNINDNISIIKNDVYKCENCTIDLLKDYIELPIKYINKIFYVNNRFCSVECANRYCYDTYSDYNEKLSLLYLYYNKLSNNINNDIINIARPISMLKHNGGHLTINNYRSNFKKINHSNNPCTLDSFINIVNNTDVNNNKIKNLKLYRTNKINKNKNNIFNKMNLDISNK